MFCKNCGKDLMPEAKFCDVCGTPAEVQEEPVEAEAPVVLEEAAVPAAPMAPVAPVVPAVPAQPVVPNYGAVGYGNVAVQKKSGKKVLILILCIVLGLAIVGGGVFFAISAINNTPEKVAETYAVAYAKYDAETLVSNMPDFMLLKQAQRMGMTYLDKAAIIAQLKAAAMTMDHPYSVTKLTATRNYLEGGSVSEFADALLDGEFKELGATITDVASLQDACIVDVVLLVDGETEEYEVICAKFGGKWYALLHE